MRIRKRMYFLSLVVVLSLVTCTRKPVSSKNAVNDPKVNLVYAEVGSLSTISGQTGLAFKEKVEELSGGSVTIVIQHSGVLGSENDILDGILGGNDTVDMARISAFGLTSYGIQKTKLLSIPYTFKNREHFWNFANSKLAAEFLNEPTELNLGLRSLFYGEEGFRNFITRKPISGLKDFPGMKMRVSNDPVMTGMVRGLGAIPTFISSGELYSALQTGVVDGAEQPISAYKFNSYYEVAPNMIMDAHTLGVIQVIITDNAWNNKLTENQRKIILEASVYAKKFNAEISAQMEKEVIKTLIEDGVNFIEVHDISEWVEACKEIISSTAAGQVSLYQKILDMKNM